MVEINKSKIYPQLSIYQNDYRVPKMTKPIFQKGNRRAHENNIYVRTKPTKPHISKNIHSLQVWEKQVPFNLYHQPKPIIRTHPKEIICEKLDEKESSGVRDLSNIRPSVYMVPAININSITDKNDRKTFCESMYTSVYKKSSAEVKTTTTKKIIPNSTFEKNKNPVTLQYDIFPPMSPESLKKAIKCEFDLYRSAVDPTKTFWQAYKPQESKLNKINLDYEEIKRLIETDKLRLAFDVTKQGYQGFKPRNSSGCLTVGERINS